MWPRSATLEKQEMRAKTTAGDVNGKSNEMKSLAVSYMGVPLHFLASLVWAAVSRLLTMFRPREQTGAGFNNPVSPAPQQPLVRLNNLPQVSGYLDVLLVAGGVVDSSRARFNMHRRRPPR